MLSKYIVVVATFFGSALAAPALLNGDKLKRVANAVENSYIIVLKNGASRTASLQSLDELIIPFSELKEVTNSDWTSINAYSATLTGAALQHVLNDPNVDYVEQNAVISINWEQEAQIYAREAAPVDEASSSLLKRQTGSGVDIYSIDTGVRITHTCFGGRARWGAVFVGAQQDGNGHGTHTAGTAAGSGFGPATSAIVIAVKVLSDTGSGSTAGVISGVEYVRNSAIASPRPSVANMSLGGSISAALDDAVRNAVAAGVHVIIAAGNSNLPAGLFSPARVAEATTVGAIDSNKAKASFSNFGIVLDVWFLGVSVTSAWFTSDTATNTISGTSMAAPGVAGLVANYISRVGNSSPAAVRNALVAAAPDDVTGVTLLLGTTRHRAVAF